MTSEQIKALCDAALQRITYFINRSAGQHIRALRETWGKAP